MKDKNLLPKHVAIIMDGNGRWANQRGLSRSEGHREGSNTVNNLLDIALELELKNISLYAFSTENWKRPILEVKSIFIILDEFITNRLDEIHKKGIKIIHSGSRGKIPKSILKKIDNAITKTSSNKAMTVNFCLNYGSHEELSQAFYKIFKNRLELNISLDKHVKSQEIERYLYTYPLPPVDLLIRTGGEKRISNFLLWQIAYAEIYFTDILWPDFNEKELLTSLDWYKSRIRRFGGL
ncbi:MAG: isoprenyl transferase [Leptospiraceae bacterium]|nr:isoprenyl transferase [Leptospiraceae bacterium]